MRNPLFTYFSIIILIAFLLTFVSAQNHYADTTIVITSEGLANISGTSDHNLLQPMVSDELTSKQGGEWNFSLYTTEVFTDYIITINFPKGAEISTITTSGDYRLMTNGEILTVIVVGQNEPLAINVKYKLNGSQNQVDFTIILWLVVLVVIIGLGYFAYKNRKILFISKTTNVSKGKKLYKTTTTKQSLKEKTSDKIVVEEKVTKETIILEALTDRQKSIMKYLSSNNGKATQREIAEYLNLPKASISRNLAALEQKGLILRERKGLTMLVMLSTKQN